MRLLTVALALSGFVVGLLASLDWFRASQIDVEPVWGDREPVDQVLSQAGWIAGILTAASESGRLNRRAALLTGVAVILTTGSGLTGLFVS
ncbi:MULTISPECIES: hypothetical protein [unclassified Duganella]|uniref:hypothetical protein n=1 Tax=unclassified Duganella TaxID=2636909 RepID=UPI001C3CDBA8|nr:MULTISPECIES: hypothetical protein [unclassified Duganella]